MERQMQQGLKPTQGLQQRYTLSYAARSIPAMLAMNATTLNDFLHREADRNPCVELVYPQAGRSDLLEEMVAAPDTDFRTTLRQQLPPHADALVLRAAAALIEQLEDTGYLPFDPLAAARGAQRSVLAQALALVQAMEPAGVGARSLRECYCLQAARDPVRCADVLALVSDEACFTLYKERDFAAVCRTLGWTSPRLAAATAVLRTLPMHPIEGEDTAEYVVPEAEIYQRTDGGYAVRLLEGLLPRVEISEAYRQSLSAGSTRFANEGLYYAKRLAWCLEHRNVTLLGLLQYAAERQADWLNGGVRVRMTLREAAHVLRLSQSTVSRTIQNKYVRIRGRVVPAAELFSRGGTQEVSCEAACMLLQQAIAEEKKEKPFSDQALTQWLHSRYGITLSRRTVTKYREQLNVPPAARRKQQPSAVEEAIP